MDGSTVEHSDSDSGESWTLLEPISVETEEAADLPLNVSKLERENTENIERDEDTDGISIISDSDRESTTPCDLSFDRISDEENRPAEQQIPKFVSVTPLPINNNGNYSESIRSDDDFLRGDSGGKLKTYVHRRNKRLSTVLNIIVLGSFITAAGVAIGHMWGIREDCKIQASPSVNKILSNLYKLQEENAYLRNKLKEITVFGNMQMQQKKSESDKLLNKQHKCKKVFEEPLNNKSANKAIKCVDSENNVEKKLESHMIQPEYEKEFIDDIGKLENTYKQNKGWLDEEVTRRMKNEEQSIKRKRDRLRPDGFVRESKTLEEPSTDTLENQQEIEHLVEDFKSPVESSVRYDFEDISNDINLQYVKETDQTSKTIDPESEPNISDDAIMEALPENKITYADSLKYEQKPKRTYKRGNNIIKIKEYYHRKKSKKDVHSFSENSMSEDELKKDDRYSGHKYKLERKKNDRQKGQKKQKRKNKYEQWEMKRGYMNDYDTVSIPSLKDNELLKNSDKNSPTQISYNNINQFSESDENIKSVNSDNSFNSKGDEDLKYSRNDKEKKNIGWFEKRTALRTEARKKLEQEHHNRCDDKGEKDTKCNKYYAKYDKEKESGWYEKRSALRTEARKKLEKELFGENTPNNAGWYFRRMQKREQCRAKGDNTTYRKHSKENWKFMKY